MAAKHLEAGCASGLADRPGFVDSAVIWFPDNGADAGADIPVHYQK